MEGEIVNRVAQSELVQIELDKMVDFSVIVEYDMAMNLYEKMILREKDFREFIRQHDWSQYKHKVVAIYCSEDVIIPNWSFMLLSSCIQSAGGKAHFGSRNEVAEKLLLDFIAEMNASLYEDKKVLVKGCSSMDMSPEIYLSITSKLQPAVKSLMFGEACSSVPVYKSKT